MGGDSAAGNGGWAIRVRADAKVFVNGPMVFGFTSSFRMGQLLRHALHVPKHFEGDADKWLSTTFIDAVRKCMKDGGYATTKDGAEVGGVFLIGYRGTLYEVHSDFQVAQTAEQYSAIGCGDQYALGRLYGNIGTPEDRICDALGAAAHFSGGVLPPFQIVEGADTPLSHSHEPQDEA